MRFFGRLDYTVSVGIVAGINALRVNSLLFENRNSAAGSRELPAMNREIPPSTGPGLDPTMRRNRV